MPGTTVSSFPCYSQYQTADLLEAYRLAPARLRQALAGLSLEQLRKRARPGKWAVGEIVCHLADADVVGAGRIRLAWCEPGSSFVAYNQERWAAGLDYLGRDLPDLEAAVALFEALRLTTGAILERASQEDWLHRWGMHPQYGPVTLRNLLELYADHGERHLDQILTLRELLGRPLDLPLLLSERLY
jgi:uncharacterized damage-inducible protein DinB